MELADPAALTIAEIDALSTRDLLDIRGDWAEMRHQAWEAVYGRVEA